MIGQFCFQRPLLCRKPPNNLTEKSGLSRIRAPQLLAQMMPLITTGNSLHCRDHPGKVVLALKWLLCCDPARSEDTSDTRAAVFH